MSTEEKPEGSWWRGKKSDRSGESEISTNQRNVAVGVTEQANSKDRRWWAEGDLKNRF